MKIPKKIIIGKWRYDTTILILGILGIVSVCFLVSEIFEHRDDNREFEKIVSLLFPRKNNEEVDDIGFCKRCSEMLGNFWVECENEKSGDEYVTTCYWRTLCKTDWYNCLPVHIFEKYNVECEYDIFAWATSKNNFSESKEKTIDLILGDLPEVAKEIMVREVK